MERVWAMPNKWTFSIPAIAKLIREEVPDPLGFIDPFAGLHSPASCRNDLNPEMPTQWHLDALEFLQKQLDIWGVGHFNGGFYDAPFSYRQASECYKKFGREHLTAQVTNNGYYAKCKDILALLVRAGGKVISCGWNSEGMGKDRGFEVERVLLVYHGGGHNDTIVTVERKIQATLLERPESP